jgi:putative transposase
MFEQAFKTIDDTLRKETASTWSWPTHRSAAVSARKSSNCYQPQRGVPAPAQGNVLGNVPKNQPSPERAPQAMPQSLARLHIHLSFSTKNREPVLHEAVRESLHRYMATVLQNVGCSPVLINSVADHVHILFELGRTVTVSTAVEEVKKTSSRWSKTQGAGFAAFAWQGGYGAFAGSESNVPAVCEYIASQREHHRKKSFQEEYRAFLERHRIAYDEQYVWG